MRDSFSRKALAPRDAERIVSWIIDNERLFNKAWLRGAIAGLWLWPCAVAAGRPPKQHELCAGCHKETVEDFLTHPHFRGGMECRLCHGESARHVASEGHAEPDRVAAPHEIPALCGGCHAGQGAVSILEEYGASRHGKLVLAQSKTRAPHCGTCHGVHNVRRAKAIEAQCRRCHADLPAACSAPARRAARVACGGCHAPHAFTGK